MKNLIIALIACSFAYSLDANGRILYSRISAPWDSTSSGNYRTWSTTSGGGTCNCIPQNNDTLMIRTTHTVLVNSTIDLGSANILINVYGVLKFGASGATKLTLSSASQVLVHDGGSMTSATNTANDKLVFGNSNVWKGNDGTVTGPSCFPANCNMPLNVTFVNFNTSVHKDIVTLNWKTSYEPNNLKFVIQRSVDGIAFSDIKEITPEHDNEYTYEDTDLPKVGILYYRIMQQDVDAKKVYSLIKPAHLHHVSMEEIYPNPAADAFNIAYFAEEEQSLKIEIIDMAGRILKIDTKKVYAGHNSYSYTATGLGMKKGMYIIKLISEENAEVSQRHFQVTGN